MARKRRYRRKRSLKFSLKKESLLSIASVFLLLLAALSFLSLVVSDGLVTLFFRKLLVELFGGMAMLVPLLVGYTGLLFFRSLKFPFLQTRILIGLVALLLSLLVLSGAGAAGEELKGTLGDLVHPIGAVVLALAGLLLSVILVLNVSLDTLLARVIAGLGSVGSFKGKRALPGRRTAEVGEGVGEDETDAVESKDRKPAFEVVPSPAEPVVNGGLEDVTAAPSGKVSTTPTLPYADKVWEYPPLSLLSETPVGGADRGDVKERAQIIGRTLESFGIRAKVVEINLGPSVTQYALETVQGTKIARITNLDKDLALSLASPTGSIRIEAPIPGKSLIGIEVPNFSPSMVTLKSVLTAPVMKKAKSKLTVALGHDVAGQPFVADIARMPHVLIAGATGSGKSVLIHSMVATLLFRCSPAEVRFILIDPKRVELPAYNEIPHLLTPVIVSPEKALPALRWALSEMDRRYRLFEAARVKNISGYNDQAGFQALPFILIVVDELADLMMTAPVESEKAICRLAQLARATGIHLVLATQRPSVDVLTGLIKANVPCRIALNVTSQVDSRVIIDQGGAEKLLGRGDMLYVPPDASKPVRIQGALVFDKERSDLVDYLREKGPPNEYEEEVVTFKSPAEVKKERGLPDDEHFPEALEIICQRKRASASLLQRRLSIGYARAARLLDDLEALGAVGPPKGSKPREVLIRDPKEILERGQKSPAEADSSSTTGTSA